jgi:teichuronic acid biosynthesis glycosyltransferase TuaG
MQKKVKIPCISIIIPVFNCQKYLAETLDSISNQSFHDIEIIVVDDCSTDKSKLITLEFSKIDRRIRYLCTKENSGGPATPRNLGIKNAKSEFIAFCDADDLWHPDKLLIQWEILAKTNSSFTYTSTKDFSFKLPFARTKILDDLIKLSNTNLIFQLCKNTIKLSSILCKKELLNKINGFNCDKKLIAVEDYDLCLRIMEKFGSDVIIKINLPLVYYRKMPDSLSSNKLKMVEKVSYVLYLFFKRKKRLFFYSFFVFIPILIVLYIISSVWLRLILRKS